MIIMDALRHVEQIGDVLTSFINIPSEQIARPLWRFATVPFSMPSALRLLIVHCFAEHSLLV